SVRVFQVRRDGASAEVRPAPDHRVADESVVRLVPVAQKYTVRQLAAGIDARADRARADRAAQDVRVGADPERSLETRTGADFGAAIEDQRTAAAWGCGPSQVPPGPAPQPTVMPPLVSRNAPSGSAGASPHGAKVDDPITTGPFTGCRAPTGGTPGSVNPAR